MDVEGAVSAIAELSDADMARLHKAFLAKAKPGVCEICGASKWNSHRFLVSPTVFDFRTVPAKAVVTFVTGLYALFSCANCGNAKQFDIKYLGFLPEGLSSEGVG